MDDLMQKGDYDKLEVSIVEEKEWHDGHEPQGGYDHYEEEEVEEDAGDRIEKRNKAFALKKKRDHEYEMKWGKKKDKKGIGEEDAEEEEFDEKKTLKLRDLNFYPAPKKKGKKVGGSTAGRPMAFGISRKGGSGPGKGYGSAKKAPIMMGDEIEEDKEDEAYGGTAKKKKSQKILKSKGYFHRKDRPAGWVEDSEVEESTTKYAKSLEKIANDKALKMLSKSERENLKKIAALLSKEKTLGEAYKDLPPHLQKLIKKIEKKQKDWNKQNPDAKIQTLVYNPETGKPDIIVKETMKLEDTVKQVLTKEPKLEEHCGVCDEQGIKEDDDKDEPGTQGDNAEYQKKRKAVAKKFGVSDCSQLDGAKKKACYSALDKAHVADHEEQVELEKMRKEETKESKTFSKIFSQVKNMMKEKKKKGNPHY